MRSLRSRERIPDLKKHWEAAAMPPKGWSGSLYFKTDTGRTLRYGHAPALGTPRGTIIFTHGYGEHIDLYYEAIKHYQAEGFDVWAMDWHDHGLSGRGNIRNPKKPDTGGLMPCVEDLHHFATKIVRRAPDAPLILNAHSMGGHIGMLYLQKYTDTFDSALFSAPMFDIYRFNLPKSARGAVRGLFHAANAVGLGRATVPTISGLADKFNETSSTIHHLLKPAKNTPRQQINRKLRQLHEKAQIKRPSFDWVKASFHTTDSLMRPQNLRRVKAHTLIVSATYEDLVDNHAHAKAAVFLRDGSHIKLTNSHHGVWFEDERAYREWLSIADRFMDLAVSRYQHKHKVIPFPGQRKIAQDLAA